MNGRDLPKNERIVGQPKSVLNKPQTKLSELKNPNVHPSEESCRPNSTSGSINDVQVEAYVTPVSELRYLRRGYC
ncbi:Protein translocase subunit SecA 2 [Bienertia sinuspersici]